jgi:hypothetical protein
MVMRRKFKGSTGLTSHCVLANVATAALLLCGCTTTAPPVETQTQSVSAQPLRQQIEAAYERNRQALLSREPAAVLALRTEDYHVVTPDGVTHDARAMTLFTHNLLSNVERWDALSFEIQSIDQQGEDVQADVRQHSSRMMRRPNGSVQRVENWVTQRETWVRTAGGWKMRRVDNIRDQRVLIDGVPRA